MEDYDQRTVAHSYSTETMGVLEGQSESRHWWFCFAESFDSEGGNVEGITVLEVWCVQISFVKFKISGIFYLFPFSKFKNFCSLKMDEIYSLEKLYTAVHSRVAGLYIISNVIFEMV